MSHMSHSESYESHCLGLLSKYQEKKEEVKEEEEFASTRPVGFAAGKKSKSKWIGNKSPLIGRDF